MFRVLVFLLLLAVMVYAVFWAIGRRNDTPPNEGGTGGGPIKRGPLGPDDDEDFLRELDRKRRQGGKPEDPV